MREAGAVGSFLEPLRLLDDILGADGGLDVNCFDNVGVARFGNVVFGEIVAFG